MASSGTSALRPDRARDLRACGLALLLACTAAASQEGERVLVVAPDQIVRYRLIEGTAGSARPVAEKLLRHLAEGDIDGAAALSNAPQRRYEELAKYRAFVGDEEFKRVFGRYFAPENRLVAEVAVDSHRLLIWRLGEAKDHIAGQYYVEFGGSFLLDEAPSDSRTRLRRVLEAYRSGKVRF